MTVAVEAKIQKVEFTNKADAEKLYEKKLREGVKRVKFFWNNDNNKGSVEFQGDQP